MTFRESKSGLMVPVDKVAKVKSKNNQCEVLAADWDRHRGSNCHRIERGGLSFGGSFRFGRHVGQPLTQQLWEDLIYRLKIETLWVIGHNDWEWTSGSLFPHATVRLDEAELVCDIEICL